MYCTLSNVLASMREYGYRLGVIRAIYGTHLFLERVVMSGDIHLRTELWTLRMIADRIEDERLYIALPTRSQLTHSQVMCIGRNYA